MTGYSRSWIYKLIGQGLLPQPIKIGVRAIGFIESEIEGCIQSLINNSRSILI